MREPRERTPKAATLGYEIPALLYSLLKPTRTLIAKAVAKELQYCVICSQQYKQGFRLFGLRILKSGGHLQYLEMSSIKHTINMGENDSWTIQNKTSSGTMHALRLKQDAPNTKYADAVCSCAYAPVEAGDKQANTPEHAEAEQCMTPNTCVS